MNNITFEQFIKTYNFRYVNESIGDKNDLCNDTCIIRIYPPSDDNEPIFHLNMLLEIGNKPLCLK